jgi:hypothetical protein
MTLTTSIDSLVEASFQSTNNISAEQLTASLVTETNKSSASSGKAKVLSYWRPRKKNFKIVYQRDSGNYFYINENGQHIGVSHDKVITSFIDATSAQASTHALSNDTEVSNGATNTSKLDRVNPDKAARSNEDEDEEQRNKTFVLNKKDQKK